MSDRRQDCAQCPLTGHACLTTVTLEKHVDQRLIDMQRATELLAVSTARERDGFIAANYALKSELSALGDRIRTDLEARRQLFEGEVETVRARFDSEIGELREFKSAVQARTGVSSVLAVIALLSSMILWAVDFFLRSP